MTDALRMPLELARDLERFTSHSIGCAIYQKSWASGAPDCSCGLDGLRDELLAQERFDAALRAKLQEPIFLKMRTDMTANYRTPTEIAACCVWAGEPSPGSTIPALPEPPCVQEDHQ